MKYKIKYHVGSGDNANIRLIESNDNGRINRDYLNLILSYGTTNLEAKAMEIVRQSPIDWNGQEVVNQLGPNHDWSNHYCPIIWNALEKHKTVILNALNIIDDDNTWNNFLTYGNNWHENNDVRWLQKYGSKLASIPMWQDYALKIILNRENLAQNINIEEESNNIIIELMVDKLIEDPRVNYYDFFYLYAFSKNDNRDNFVEAWQNIEPEMINGFRQYLIDFYELALEHENINIVNQYLKNYIKDNDLELEGLGKLEKYASANLPIRVSFLEIIEINQSPTFYLSTQDMFFRYLLDRESNDFLYFSREKKDVILHRLLNTNYFDDIIRKNDLVDKEDLVNLVETYDL